MKTPRDGWDRDERLALEALGDELEALRARHENDPPVSQLRAAGADVLPEPLETSAAEHLSQSPWSRALLEGLDDVEAPLGVQEQDRILERIRKQTGSGGGSIAFWTWLWRPAFAATALAAIGIVAWVTWQASRPGPQPPAREDVVAVARPPEVPAFELPVDKPDVKLSAAALTWRGRAGGDNPFLADARAAFDAYRGSDYAAAIREFSALEARYPDVVEVAFYLGVSQLLHGDATAAIAALERADRLGDPAFASDVDWYRALAEHRAGHSAEADSRFEALCRQAGIRGEAACGALERLRAAAQPPR